MRAVTFSLREEPFAITGATREELRRALAVLGPVRGGARYAAYTDWEVTYRVRPAAPVAERLAVDVNAVVRLPKLRAPRAMSGEVAAAWSRYVDALARHEDGHVAIARAAGEAVFGALSALSVDAPAAIVARAAAAAITEVRAAERAYDAETRHGAAQGVVFFS